MTFHTLQPRLVGLIPLALSAFINAGPAEANPSSTSLSPIGVDLGSSAEHLANPFENSPLGAGHEMRHAGTMPMAYEGHVHAQASGTVNSVDAGAHKSTSAMVRSGIWAGSR